MLGLLLVGALYVGFEPSLRRMLDDDDDEELDLGGVVTDEPDFGVVVEVDPEAAGGAVDELDLGGVVVKLPFRSEVVGCWV